MGDELTPGQQRAKVTAALRNDPTRVCGAKRKNGKSCRMFAGTKTEHVGTGRCWLHGGNTPNHNISAARKEAARRMAAMGAPLDVRPSEALLWVVHATAGHAAFLGAEVAALNGLDGHEARVLIEQYGAERDRLTRAAKAALDAGAEKREVIRTEQIAEKLAQAMNAAMRTLDLTPDQRRQFQEVLRLELQVLDEPVAPALAGTARER